MAKSMFSVFALQSLDLLEIAKCFTVINIVISRMTASLGNCRR